MGDLWRAGELAQSMVVIATTAGFPPFSSGAFWGIMSLWGIVTILFDDETPRGVPGIEHLSTHPRHDTQGQHP
jgi:hypothetical protein